MKKLLALILVLGFLVAYNLADGKSGSSGSSYSPSRSYSAPPSRPSPPPARPTPPPPAKSYTPPPAKTTPPPTKYTPPPSKSDVEMPTSKEMPRTFSTPMYSTPAPSYDPFPSYLIWYYFLFHRDRYDKQRDVVVVREKEAKKAETIESKTEEGKPKEEIKTTVSDKRRPVDIWLWINLIGIVILLVAIAAGIYLLIKKWRKKNV